MPAIIIEIEVGPPASLAVSSGILREILRDPTVAGEPEADAVHLVSTTESRRSGSQQFQRPTDSENQKLGGPEARRPRGSEAQIFGDPETWRPGEPETRRTRDSRQTIRAIQKQREPARSSNSQSEGGVNLDSLGGMQHVEPLLLGIV